MRKQLFIYAPDKPVSEMTEEELDELTEALLDHMGVPPDPEPVTEHMKGKHNQQSHAHGAGTVEVETVDLKLGVEIPHAIRTGATPIGIHVGPDAPPRDAATMEAIRRDEAKTIGNDFETLSLVGAGGKSVMYREGNATSVDISDAEIESIRARGDVVATHNHPGGTSLSPNDVRTAIEGNLVAIRAVGKNPADGKAWQYEMARPEGGWPTKGQFEGNVISANTAARSYFNDRIARGKTEADPFEANLREVRFANSNHTDVVNQILATRLDISYSREPYSG